MMKISRQVTFFGVLYFRCCKPLVSGCPSPAAMILAETSLVLGLEKAEIGRIDSQNAF